LILWIGAEWIDPGHASRAGKHDVRRPPVQHRRQGHHDRDHRRPDRGGSGVGRGVRGADAL